MKRAETHHTQDTSNEADELLSQFKVVSVDNMEDEELERYDPGKDWDDIIPEEERKKVTEEEIQKELMALNLPPRQRKQVTKV